jgi:hypothetical protein
MEWFDGPPQAKNIAGCEPRWSKKTGDEVPPVAEVIRSATPSPSKKRGEEKALVFQLFHVKHR